jgi:ABC-type Fe3+-citrate transport system substrate-binding protein
MMATLTTAIEKRKNLERQLDEANETIFELKQKLEASKVLRASPVSGVSI